MDPISSLWLAAAYQPKDIQPINTDALKKATVACLQIHLTGVKEDEQKQFTTKVSKLPISPYSIQNIGSVALSIQYKERFGLPVDAVSYQSLEDIIPPDILTISQFLVSSNLLVDSDRLIFQDKTPTQINPIDDSIYRVAKILKRIEDIKQEKASIVKIRKKMVFTGIACLGGSLLYMLMTSK